MARGVSTPMRLYRRGRARRDPRGGLSPPGPAVTDLSIILRQVLMHKVRVGVDRGKFARITGHEVFKDLAFQGEAVVEAHLVEHVPLELFVDHLLPPPARLRSREGQGRLAQTEIEQRNDVSIARLE